MAVDDFGGCYGHSSHCTCGRPPLPTCGHATCRAGVPCKQLPPPVSIRPSDSFARAGHTLTDADVERVARRVVEMLAERLAR